MFGYLKHHPKARLVFDPTDPNLDGLDFLHNDWIELYPDAKEAIPDDAPKCHDKRELKLTVYVDASHADCMLTRRSVTGYLVVLGRAPIKWYCKRQNTVETATYGSELVAMRIAIEAVLEIRYKMRMMGLLVEEPSVVLCDNHAVIINTQLPSSNLKKKHNSVAFHKCREAVAAGIVKTAHVDTTNNIADIFTKPKRPADHYRLTRQVLFGHED
jgi:hypothetical protein